MHLVCTLLNQSRMLGRGEVSNAFDRGVRLGVRLGAEKASCGDTVVQNAKWTAKISQFILRLSGDIHHHRGTPLFSVCRPTPRSQSKKKTMVYTIFLGKQGKKGIHHRSGKKGIHHRASDPEKEKRGSPRWWCILFSSLI